MGFPPIHHHRAPPQAKLPKIMHLHSYRRSSWMTQHCLTAHRWRQCQEGLCSATVRPACALSLSSSRLHSLDALPPAKSGLVRDAHHSRLCSTPHQQAHLCQLGLHSSRAAMVRLCQGQGPAMVRLCPGQAWAQACCQIAAC